MRAALIGVGMIGGSLLAAWRRAGVVSSAVGFDIEPKALAQAARAGLIDRSAESVADAVADADLVVIATPVGAMGAVFAQLAPALSPQALVTDVGSTKISVIEDAHATLGDKVSQFVPAHPIAGKELPGVEHADATLFKRKRVIVTPTPTTSAQAVARVEALFAEAGARVERMDPAEHDRIFAAVSHLPHLLSFALVANIAAGADGERKLAYAGAGFRDFTRIAAGSPVMWRDICTANRIALGAELRAYRDLLESLQRAVDCGDSDSLQRTFAKAAGLRRKLGATLDAQ